MGPTSTAGNCSTVGSRTFEKSNSASLDYFICGFEIKISDNQTAEPGVYSIAPFYATIDFPTLLRSSKAEGCELTAHLDYFYVRNSAWDFTQGISNDTQCGTQQKVYNLGDSSHNPRADEINPGFKHSAVYYQVITQESGGESGGLINGSGIRISRSGLWEATAFCYYDAEGRVHSSFGVEREDSLVLHGTQEFTYKMQISQSSAFTSFFDPSAATALLNDEVYVKVSFESEVNHDYTLITTDCWATQTEDYTSNTRYVLSANKCPSDDSFERLTGSELDEEFFQFKAFGWYISGTVTLNTVYIHCKVLACPPQETSACDINCSKRQKRDLGSLASGDGVDSKVKTGLVSSSPIVVVRRDITEQTALTGPNSTYSPLAASLASLFILVAFAALLAAIGLFVVKQRKISSGRAYLRLDTNHAD
ncbi:oncoprotein-induced transcript 3 protein-like [Convolutriloba macropyga]|uniref:oncoprotein-induced transcript 3 protein-like n=1 Tax=Convolutriloba macropyga TaxID=536237 RepID=UPI003F51FB02